MKKPIDLHAEVTRIVKQHWPRLVGEQMIKLQGAKPIVKKQIPRKPGLQTFQEMHPTLDLVKDDYIYQNALTKHGSRVKAAAALGIAGTTFRDRLKREVQATQPLRGGDLG